LPTQLALVCVAVLVSPATVTVHDAVVAAIAMLSAPRAPACRCCTRPRPVPSSLAEYEMAGVALVQPQPRRQRVAQADPRLRRIAAAVGQREDDVVVAASLIGLAPNVLATDGRAAPSPPGNWLVTPLVDVGRRADVARAVGEGHRAGRAARVRLRGRFVTPVTVIVHEAVPLLIDTPENAIVSGAPCVTTLVPEHPAPKLTVGAADVKRRLAGRAVGEGDPRLRRGSAPRC